MNCPWPILNPKGKISVRSNPGSGTVFTIELPLADPQPKTEPAETNGLSEEIIKGNNEKILVVDDDDAILVAIPALLNGLGYRAATASNIETALDIFKSWEPEIVLLDRNFTGQNGLTCAEQMRKLNDQVRIAIVSGFDREDCTMAMGEETEPINGYLTKPVDTCRLSRLLLTLRDEAAGGGGLIGF